MATLLFCCCLAFLEALYATTGVEEFFLASKEWVALAADFNVDLWESRANAKFCTASARHFRVAVVFGVDSFLHNPPRLPDNMGLCNPQGPAYVIAHRPGLGVVYFADMKERIILALGISLLLLGIQGRLFGPQPVSTPPAALAPIIQTVSKDGNLFVVTRVVDGDTIVVTVPGSTEKVRLIGVDTPETVDPRKPVQCFGKQASDFLKSLLTGKSVRLERDPTQDDRDKYGRLLRYVYLDDTLVNELIISRGYGHEYTYRIPYLHQYEFKKEEYMARQEKMGLWADGVCGLSNVQK